MVSAGGLTLPIRYSSKERAVLELLNELPEHESFHQADALMEGMSDLSPRRLQTLLEACASVKVKRPYRNGTAYPPPPQARRPRCSAPASTRPRSGPRSRHRAHVPRAASKL